MFSSRGATKIYQYNYKARNQSHIATIAALRILSYSITAVADFIAVTIMQMRIPLKTIHEDNNGQAATTYE